MFTKSFTGGINPDQNKEITSKLKIETSLPPKIVDILLLQHSGSICKPLVNIGDYVKMGQMIGDSDEKISCPVHSSISGKVIKIEPHLCFSSQMINAVTIENDFKDEIVTHDPTSTDFLSAIRQSGIAGLGGAAFPTHIKLSPPKDKKIEYLIINGAECEPYITCDYRVMQEEPEYINQGIDICRSIFRDVKVIVAKHVGTKYPQGGEKQLIKALLGREVPSGGFPYDIGVVVINVQTCVQIAKSIKTGMPMIDRVLTVTGKHLKNPKNLRVKLGTSFKDLIEQCGGEASGQMSKVLAGGPMMGTSVPSLDVPVVKGTSGILVLSEKETKQEEPLVCIKCARCVDACPMQLLPNFIAEYSDHKKYDKAEKLGAKDCIECGCCSYVCPVNLNLVQSIRNAKARIKK